MKSVRRMKKVYLPSTVAATTAAASAPTFPTAARHFQIKAQKTMKITLFNTITN